jgi:hypothetical protein
MHGRQNIKKLNINPSKHVEESNTTFYVYFKLCVCVCVCVCARAVFLPVWPFLTKHVIGTQTSKTSINCNVFSNAEKENIINTVRRCIQPSLPIIHKLCISVLAYNSKQYSVCKWTAALEDGLKMKYSKTFCQEQPLHLPTGFVKKSRVGLKHVKRTLRR